MDGLYCKLDEAYQNDTIIDLKEEISTVEDEE
jgi:hypothetical protein